MLPAHFLRDVVRHVARRSHVLRDRLVLHVDRHGDMRHAAIGERSPAGERHDIGRMGRAHDARVVDGDVHVKLVELHVLLREGVEKVVELEAGDGEHRRLIEFGVIESVQEMDAARPGSRDADPEPPGPFRIGACCEGGSLLMADLNEADFVFPPTKRFDQSVNAIARNSEYCVHSPVDQSVDEHVAGGQ